MASTISAGTTVGTALNMTGDTTGNLAFQTGAGANTITVPNGTGTIAVNGVSTNIVSGTAVASTSGTSIDFTSIPSWVKRVSVCFSGVSTSGSSIVLVRVGSSSGVVSTGYSGFASVATNVSSFFTTTTGIPIQPANASAAAYIYSGNVVFTNISGNTWTANGSMGSAGYDTCSAIGGVTPALAGVLDRVRITTVNGTDTFDAGSINILYE